jgi:hypothetical protein
VFTNQAAALWQCSYYMSLLLNIVMKSKKLLIAALITVTALSATSFLNSCSSGKMYAREGIVEKIEYGKDGYTASLKDEKGKDFDAIISRVRMEKTYKVLKAGDKVKLSGDTIHFDNKVRILVNNIK